MLQRRKGCQCTLPSLPPSSGSFASSLPRSTSGSESSLPSQVVRRTLGVTSGPIFSAATVPTWAVGTPGADCSVSRRAAVDRRPESR